MTRVSHLRRSRILPPSSTTAPKKDRSMRSPDALATLCRVIFERLRPQLIETHYNLHIAIDSDTESYLLEPTLDGIVGKIRHVILVSSP